MHPIGHSAASTRLKKGLKASFQMKKWAIVAPVEKKDFEKKEEEKNFVKDELEKERKKEKRSFAVKGFGKTKNLLCFLSTEGVNK